tara:strand:+ start:1498 stop:1653 length:156 start_codon:yes stop_codon:yes gene_type:complete
MLAKLVLVSAHRNNLKLKNEVVNLRLTKGLIKRFLTGFDSWKRSFYAGYLG